MAVDPWSWSFALVVAGALVASTVRGFSGFGAAMVLVPILAAVYGPRVAVPVLLVLDGILTLPMVAGAVRRCAWREVAPLLLGYAVAFPLGLTVLLVADAAVLTKAMATVVLLVVLAMALGLRRRTLPGPTATVATGGLSGLLAGATGIGGPPVILFWLAGQDPAARTRANVVAFFAATSVVSAIGLAGAGVLTADVLVLTAVLMPPYAVGLLLGTRAFGHASDALYRRLALVVIGAVGLGTLAFA